MKPVKNPMPTIEFEGKVYSLKNRNTDTPNLNGMTRMQQLLWLNENTRPKGYTKNANPLAGLSHLLQTG